MLTVDHPTLQIGDEIKCARCPRWHPTYVKYPDEPAIDSKASLYFECPKRSASFYAGRIGDPPHAVARWRRPLQ